LSGDTFFLPEHDTFRKDKKPQQKHLAQEITSHQINITSEQHNHFVAAILPSLISSQFHCKLTNTAHTNFIS